MVILLRVKLWIFLGVHQGGFGNWNFNVKKNGLTFFLCIFTTN